MEVVTHVVAVLAGVLFACWRLRGQKTVSQAVKFVIMGGGGPGEEKPR